MERNEREGEREWNNKGRGDRRVNKEREGKGDRNGRKEKNKKR